MFLNCYYSYLSHPPFFNMLGGFNIPIKSIEDVSVSFFSMKCRRNTFNSSVY